MGFIYREGSSIPNEVTSLTLQAYGMGGQMYRWFTLEKEKMHAVIYTEGDKYLGWCAYVWVNDKTVKVGTFVAPAERKRKLGEQLVKRAMMHLGRSKPQTDVWYGASTNAFFNTIYKEAIEAAELNPVRTF